MKKKHLITAALASAALLLAGCAADNGAEEPGAEQPAADEMVFVKDDAATETFAFDFAIIGPEEESLAADAITVKGEDATLLEIMDWYFPKKELNLEHDGQVVSVLGDLAADKNQGWIVYLDDEMAPVGAAELIPADGDIIEWRYVNYDELDF